MPNRRLAVRPDEAARAVTDLLTAKEIADVLKMDQSHVYQLIKREMKHTKIGRSVRVDRSEFERWLSTKAESPQFAKSVAARPVPRIASKGTGVRPSQLLQERKTA